MKIRIETVANPSGSCPNGGDHTPGSSGEWVGRCTKCGQPC
jgi:hypothetical protein